MVKSMENMTLKELRAVMQGLGMSSAMRLTKKAEILRAIKAYVS
jgi:hypothetical protein